MTLEEKKQKYIELCHAMQTGVAYAMQNNPTETTTKHLRVGVNSAMVEHSAIVRLLIKKGIITEEEYYDALIEAMQQEVESYEKQLSQQYGRHVTLA